MPAVFISQVQPQSDSSSSSGSDSNNESVSKDVAETAALVPLVKPAVKKHCTTRNVHFAFEIQNITVNIFAHGKEITRHGQSNKYLHFFSTDMDQLLVQSISANVMLICMIQTLHI